MSSRELFDRGYLDALYDWQIESTSDRSSQALILAEQAQRLEHTNKLSRPAYQKWRRAFSRAPQLNSVRAALTQYVSSEMLTPEERSELLEFLEEKSARLDRVELGLVEAERLEEMGDANGAVQCLEESLEEDPHNRQTLGALASLTTRLHGRRRANRWLNLWMGGTKDPALEAVLALEAAEQEAAAGDHRSALEYLENGRRTSPRDPSILRAARRTYKLSKRWHEAAQTLEQEAQIAQYGGRDARYEAARILGRRLGSHDQALALLKPLLDTAPDMATLRLNREAGLETGAEDLSDACHRLAECATHPEEKARYYWLESEEIREGSKSVRLLERAVDSAPQYVTASLALELANFQPDAGSDLVDALTRRGHAEESPGLIVYAGRLAVDTLNDPRRGEALFREALQTVSTTDALFGPFGAAEALLELLDEQGRGEEEVELITWVLDQSIEESRRLALTNRLADVLTAVGRGTTRALDGWRSVLSLDPHDGYAYARLGGELVRQERWEDLYHLRETETDLSEIVDRERSEILRWECAEILHRKLANVDEALKILEHGVERATFNLPYVLSCARILIRTQRDRSLASLYRRQLERATESQQVTRLALNLAILHERQLADPTKAVHYYQQVLEHSPNNRIALDALVTLGDHIDDPSLATQAIAALVHLEKDDNYAAYLNYRLGERLERLHSDLEGAIPAYARALQRDQQMVSAALGWERCVTKLGQFDILRQQIERMVEADPGGSDSKEWLERLVVIAGAEKEGRVIEQLLTQDPTHLGALLRLLLRSSARNSLPALSEVYRAIASAILPGTTQSAFAESHALFSFIAGDQHKTEESLWQIIEMRHSDPVPLVRLLASLETDNARVRQTKVYGAFARGAMTAVEQASYLTALGRILADDGQYDRAGLALEEVLRIRSEHLPAIKLIRILAEDVGESSRFADAVELEANASTDPAQAIRHLLRSAEIRRRKLGDIEGAANALLKILDVDPKHEQAFRGLQELYMSQSRFDDLYQLLMRRASALPVVAEKKKVLLRAAELAYDRIQDMDKAVAAHKALLAVDPQFLRSYRIIAEIHMEMRQWDRALKAFEGVLKLAKDRTLIGRTWFRLGEIFEEHIKNAKAAIDAFRRTLEYLPEYADALLHLANIYGSEGMHEDEVAALKLLGQAERIPLKRKEVLLRLCDLLIEKFSDAAGAEEVLIVAREIDPDDFKLTEHVVELYEKRKWTERRTTFLASSFDEYRDLFHANVSKPSPLHAMYKVSLLQEDRDRQFTISSVLSFVGSAEPEQQAFYQSVLEANGRRLPNRPLPTARTSGLFAPGLHLNILHLMRHTEPFVSRFSPHNLRLKKLSRKHKITGTSRPELGVLTPFARVFGIELPDVYIVPDRGESMAFVAGDEPAFILDERDLESVMLPETMVRVAIGCAALSMGLATYATVDRSTFEKLLLGAISAVVPNRRVGRPEHQGTIETIARAIPKKVTDSLTGYVLEIMDKIDEKLLAQQHQAVISTSMRLGLLTAFDPRPGLTVIARDGDGGAFDVVSVMKDALLFLVGDVYCELRKEVGIAAK
ncbi:MAG: hypothetical protein CO108_26160 [Deltaproteobacteria bacterium CG_4_9_14_3_um_filter_63_12]|nr:MAG: hypothetical protein CO108_26160 [Deltaproteobacteria bacterium CG_4_9_14_3_um_filter_63_12]